MVSNHRFNRDTRPSLRDGVNGVVRALPGVRDLIVAVARESSPCALSTSPGVPGPHAFAVRNDIANVKRCLASIASRLAFVTIAIRPSCRGGTALR